MQPRSIDRVAAAAWVLALALLTLTPQPILPAAREDLPRLSVCVICGAHGTADAILNALLFLPAALLLPRSWRRPLAVAAVAFLVSAAIETTQHFIPGRYSNLGDVVWNTAGGVVGYLLASTWRRWTVPSSRAAERLALGAVAGIALVTFGFGILMAPAWTRDRYWGQWTPRLGTLEQYRGQVVEARLGDLALPPRQFPDDEDPREVLTGDWTLSATVVKGPPPGSLAPVVSIFDGHQREVLMLAAEGEDLIYSERKRADVVRLDRPEIRFVGALEGVAPGDTMHLALRRRGTGRCLAVDGRETCRRGYSPARSWALVLYHHVPAGARRAMDVVWLALLLLPVGLWSRGPRALLLHLGLGAAAVAAAVLSTGLLAGSWTAVASVPGGAAAGYLLGVVARRGAPGPDSPPFL